MQPSVDVVPMAGKFSGIDMSNPRFGYRNVATMRLDDMLGLDITTRTEMSIYRGKLGTVAERAPGVSAKGSRIRALRNKLSDAEVEVKHAVARQMDGYKPGEDWTRLHDDTSMRRQAFAVPDSIGAGKQCTAPSRSFPRDPQSCTLPG